MSKSILLAAVISTITIGLHVYGGGIEVHEPILDANLTTILKAYTSILWHAVTVILVINTGGLFLAAFKPLQLKILSLLISIQYLAFAGLFIFYGLSQLGTLLLMPQWIIFICMSALISFGIWRQKTP
jgi:hypothetical protein